MGDESGFLDGTSLGALRAAFLADGDMMEAMGFASLCCKRGYSRVRAIRVVSCMRDIDLLGMRQTDFIAST